MFARHGREVKIQNVADGPASCGVIPRFFRLAAELFRDEGGGRTQTAQSTLDRDPHLSETGPRLAVLRDKESSLPDLEPTAASCS
jgi:hypothetical protein